MPAEPATSDPCNAEPAGCLLIPLIRLSFEAMPPAAPATTPLRPPLKWAGGKRWLVPLLRPYWETHSARRLVEPLCGGLAVSLGLMPEHALLNDVNPHNINFFRWLRTGLTVDIEMANEEGLYYRHRTKFNDVIAQTDCSRSSDSSAAQGAKSKLAAELFYYLNRTGYNGLCRFNRKGEFNVPFGRHATINYVRDFSAYVPTLADWDFRHGDFEDLPLEPDDFIYADPPYDVEFTQYTKEGFGWDGQVRLARWLARHPGPVVLSNQATPRILALYRQLGFRLRKEAAPRMISCNGDRTPAVEVIATRNL